MVSQVYTLFGQPVTGTTLVGDTASYTRGMQFTLSQQASLTGIWWYSPPTAAALPTSCGIYLAANPAAGSGVLLVQNTSPTWSGAAGSGWVKCSFPGTTTLFPSIAYKVCVQFNGGSNWYSSTASYWTSGPGGSGLTSGIITAPNNTGADGGQDSSVNPSTGSQLTYPSGTTSGANLWIDVEVTATLTAPVPPVPGFTLTTPRTWHAQDQITVPRLRSDMYNLAGLFTQARPLLVAQSTSGSIAANTTVLLAGLSTPVNTWNVPFTPVPAGTANVRWGVPVAGWYLAQGVITQDSRGGSPGNARFTWGLQTLAGTTPTTTNTDCGSVAYVTSGTLMPAGGAGADLVQLSPSTGDSISIYGFNTLTNGSAVVDSATLTAEWVALPSGSLPSYTGPLGTVISAPKPVSLWPPGPGGTLSAQVAAGGTLVPLGPVAGLRAGQVIGLDWLNGQQAQPAAETVTVSSVAGGTLTTTATSYAHAAGAPVAVPVSAAFLNEQVRDVANFLGYPPILRATQTATQSIPSGSPSSLTGLTSMSAGSAGSVDNFSGFSGSTYTIQVSGTYLVIGTVWFAGSTATTAWGAAVTAGGTVYMGDRHSSSTAGGAVPMAATVRKELRLVAGQTVSLSCFQTSGAAVSTVDSATQYSRLLVVFRSL